MTKTPQYPTLIIPGSSGRLGRLLRGAYCAMPAPKGMCIFGARDGTADLVIDADDVPGRLPAADAVVALWGVTAGTAQDLERNTDLVQASVDVARAAGATRVFHMSSAAIYGPGAELSEASLPAPANAYGHAKLAAEQAVAQLKDETMAHCCLRLANVVGADSLAPALRAGPDTPMTLTRFSDGQGPQRSYVAPGHLLGILFALSALPRAHLPRVLNIAASAPISMQALGDAVSKSIQWKPETPQDRQVVTLSTSQLAGLLPGLALHKTAKQMIADWTEADTQA
ncbi:MAG: NAD-dependent epimerase/dehydratase family protein [Roseovarius sp.]